MTLPSTGPISLAQVATELGISQTGINLNDSRVRTLAGVASGPITLANLRGKTNLSAVGVNGESQVDSNGGNGTIFCGPSAIPSGQGPFTYSWSFISNPDGCNLTNATGQYCSVSHGYSRYFDGTFNATLQCVVSNGAASVTVSPVYATMTVTSNV